LRRHLRQKLDHGPRAGSAGERTAALGLRESGEARRGHLDIRQQPKQRKGRPYKVGSRGPRDKRAIVSLVERGGSVRSFHVENADKATVASIVTQNIARESRLHTDESRLYRGADGYFASHETVKHARKEYVRGDVHTNSAEGFFSIFKRGMRGVYQHCSEKHLHRYLAEYDFRFNHRIALGTNDEGRAVMALKGAVGKRLTYETIG